MKKFFYLSILLLSGVFTNAQMLLNENFNYGVSSDTLTNPTNGGVNWKRHSGSGGPIQYVPSSLSYSGYASSGVAGSAQLVNASGSREDANIPVNITTSGSVYVSLLLNVVNGGGTTGDYFFHLNDSQGTGISSTFRGKLWVKDGSSAGTFQLGLTKGAAVSSAVFTSNLSLNTTYLVVLKYVFNTASSSDDSTYLWVFSSGIPATEPAATLTATDISQTDLPRFRSVCLRQGTVGTDTVVIDGIRVSNIWANAPLPVEFTSVSATSSKNRNTITWSTASEKNNSHFEIERSVDGSSFSTIGIVKGSGNSNEARTYNFTDGMPAAGINYYRVRQVDFDGASGYSQVVTANKVAQLVLSSAPNPFNTELVLNVKADHAVNAAIGIYDMTGKLHHSETKALDAGDNSTAISTAAMPAGIYLVRISHDGEVTTQKIIKK